MDRRLRTSRLIFRTTSTSSGIGCRQGATSRRRCDEWIFRRWMAVRARWAFQLSRIESPRKLSVATLSRVWSRRSTPTPMATGPANRRQFTMNVWCTPEVICTAHRADEIAQLGRDSRPAKAIGIAELWSLRYLSAKHVELLAKD